MPHTMVFKALFLLAFSIAKFSFAQVTMMNIYKTFGLLTRSHSFS